MPLSEKVVIEQERITPLRLLSYRDQVLDSFSDRVRTALDRNLGPVNPSWDYSVKITVEVTPHMRRG